MCLNWGWDAWGGEGGGADMKDASNICIWYFMKNEI